MIMAKTRRGKIWGWVVVLILVVIIVVGLLNRDWIYDWYRGISYKPEAEMVAIRDKLKLTGWGEFLFNAAQPELNEASDFNVNCRQYESEVAVLGCYTTGNIYVYNITDAKLAGIRELTTAHELLHVVWAHMSESEKKELEPILQQVYRDNLDVLKNDIETYAEGERLEEMFVRAGTEIKQLPAVLEKRYAEIFKDQDKVVDFYNSYIAVFREIKEQMEKLANEIEVLKSEIDAKMLAYDAEVVALNADVTSFNSCAEIVGCFASEWEFYAQRNTLIARETALSAMSDEISNLIDIYNAKVDEYNADAIESDKLQNIIDSKAGATEIK